MELIDLHVHSNASDGSLTPSEVADEAIRMGLKAIALTDHDTVDGVAEILEYTKDKDEFNQKVIDILLEYDLITKDNLETLIEDGKINNTESEGNVDDKEVE